jgi:hypothetical protein
MSDHTDVVARVKDDLIARGVTLAGACGAFEITRRVLWELRAEGWGYVAAPPGGENCTGVRTDKGVRPGGTFVDCLVDAGRANGPSWQERAATPAEIEAYRPLVDPGPLPGVAPAAAPPAEPPAAPIPAPDPATSQPAPASDADPGPIELLAELRAIEAKLAAVAGGEAPIVDALGHLQATIDRLAITGIRLHF